MFGNKTLYTTTKCRSMTTKSEFVEMWNKEEKKYESEGLLEDLGIVNKKYFVYFGYNAIKCTSYLFSPFGEYVGLLYGDERIALIEIDIITNRRISKKE